MKASMWWGNHYIMQVECKDYESFVESCKEHIELYWEPVNDTEFYATWKELFTNYNARYRMMEFYCSEK